MGARLQDKFKKGETKKLLAKIQSEKDRKNKKK
jgi:hypothetical protein